MHIVVDIPEEVYRAYKMDVTLSFLNADQRSTASWYLISGLVDGTPLPKGHGKLKDIDKFLKRVEEDRAHECYLHSWTADMVLERLNSWYAPTIIEADTESEARNADSN